MNKELQEIISNIEYVRHELDELKQAVDYAINEAIDNCIEKATPLNNLLYMTLIEVRDTLGDLE